MGWREPSQVSKNLELLNRKGIEYKNAQVVELELEKNRIKTTRGDIDYDYLIIALGADLAVDTLPGFSDGSYTPYSLEGAVKLKDALRSFAGGDIVVLISSLPFKCPAAPYETALLADYFFKKRKIRGKTSIRLLTPETLPMGVAGPQLGKAVVGMLETNEIGFTPHVKPTHISPVKKEITFESGDTVGYDLLIGVPPHKSPDVVRGSGLAGYASGNFYAIPKPVINFKKPGRMWHLSKILFERWWMRHWF